MIEVMIVEDQAMLRESLAQTIESQEDMHVAACLADAADAPGRAAETDCGLVLMDVCTEHDSNGIVAARRIKEANPAVRVVIMTGMPEVTFVEQAKDAGVDSFVYKNVGIEELLAVMRSTAAGYSTFPHTPGFDLFRRGGAHRRRDLDPAPCLRGEDPQGDRRRALHERGDRQTPHRRDPGKDGLRQHPAPRRTCRR